MAKETISVELDIKSPADRKNLEETLKKLAALPYDDRNRISQIINNSKALKALADRWMMLKMMF